MRKQSKQLSQQQSAAASRRGQKTLGWFLSEELLEKTSSPSPPIQIKTLANQTAGEQKEEKKRRRGGRRTRKLTESLSTASEASLPAEAEEEKKIDSSASDFYVYDVASDGYYYEQNGAKGWRRRLPQGVQVKRQPNQEDAQQAAMTQLIQRHQAQIIQSAAAAAALQQQPTAYNRYYDATSDGYFFEMASVDGWRKRTAAPTSGASVVRPASGDVARAYGMMNGFSMNGQQQQAQYAQPQQSYGAALARGELPAKCVIDSSASSSVSDDLSYPSLSRPTSLDLPSRMDDGLDDDRLFRWDTDKLIQELVGQFSCSTRLDGFDNVTDKTPATSMWHRRFSDQAAAVIGSGPSDLDEEEQECEYALIKELEDIWKTPTPVQN